MNILLISYVLLAWGTALLLISFVMYLMRSRKVTFERWPWQKGYSWAGMDRTAPLNMSGARFGAGWKYKLGIAIGGRTIMLELLFGIIRIEKR